jgi:hypothetical protein
MLIFATAGNVVGHFSASDAFSRACPRAKEPHGVVRPEITGDQKDRKDFCFQFETNECQRVFLVKN